ncbi:MFS transporter [Streptomyces sp. SAS_267]|uniref:MFS transporter n=1 Tax=unclassified Streptomyces TaxID=2593676 RepID=UPI0037022414
MSPVRNLTKLWHRPDNVPALTRPARLFVLGNSVSALGSGLAMPYFAIFLLGVHGGSVGAVGVLAIISVVDVVTQRVLASPLEQRLGSRLPAIAGCWAQAAGWTLMALSAVQWQVFLCAAAIGVGNALFFSVRINLQMEVVDEAAHSYAFSLRYLLGNVGMMLGGVIGGATVSWLGSGGIKVLLLANSATFVVFALILTMAVPPSGPVPAPGTQRTEKEHATPHRWNGRLTGLVAGYFCIVAAGLVQFEAVLPLQLTRHGDMAPSMAGYLFSAFALSTVALQMPVSRLSTRLGGLNSIRALAAAWTAGAAILWASQTAPPLLHGTAIVLGTLTLAFGECFFSPAVPSLLKTQDTELRRRTGSLVASAHSLGQFIGPSIGIILVTHSDTALYGLVAVGAVIAATAIRPLSTAPVQRAAGEKAPA